MYLKQFIVTPSMGKRLMAKAMLLHPAVENALENHTIVVVAGSTNAYVAEELLRATGQLDGFQKKGFRRGMVVPPSFDASSVAVDFPGDVVIKSGQWQRGKTIFDVVGDLHKGDVLIKGANAVNIEDGEAGVLVGHPEAGTVGAALPISVGRRVQLIVPVGLEKRVTQPIPQIAAELNTPEAEGPRMMPLPGEVVTELDAIEALTGAPAELMAGGGVYGAEGAYWIAVKGEQDELEEVETLMASLADEPQCEA
ncbi:MAG: hypothetical protein ACLFVU_12530 [Phycisphaerae bacterium]